MSVDQSADPVPLRQAADELAEAWNRIARPISRINPEFLRRRWSVRGELRTREQFGQPAPGDFKGRGAA